MLTEILYKWFRIEPFPCAACEVLKDALATERQFNKVLFEKLLDKDKPEPLSQDKEPLIPIQPQFVPWRVRQQMLEAEDRKKAELLKHKSAEIAELEKELDIPT